MLGLALLALLSALALWDLYGLLIEGRVHATAWRGHRGEWIIYQAEPSRFVASVIFELFFAAMPFAFAWLRVLGRRKDREMSARIDRRALIDAAIRQTADER